MKGCRSGNVWYLLNKDAFSTPMDCAKIIYFYFYLHKVYFYYGSISAYVLLWSYVCVLFSPTAVVEP